MRTLNRKTVHIQMNKGTLHRFAKIWGYDVLAWTLQLEKGDVVA